MDPNVNSDNAMQAVPVSKPVVAAQPPPRCRTVTLTDEPKAIDAFDGGPHQRIADAIAGLITPADAKGIAIGIEGNWGSGKSTVARLLTDRLEHEETQANEKVEGNIATVNFDAWAHEGDPLRRTFLETLIRKLQRLCWVKEDLWNQRIEVLANRREEVSSEDNLSVTFWGRVIMFTLLLVPIGTAFVNAALREQVTFARGPIAWKFWFFFVLGLALSFSPVIVLLLRINKEPDKDLLSLFLNKGPTKKTTITSRTVNPTSIEFETKFEQLLEEAIGSNDKKVVLILDNLDRVDASDALSIWSTLQTFFQHKGTARPNWHDRLWLIVLYDYNGLKKLWTNKNAESNQNDQNTQVETNTALSFIDKSFQVRFEVPALVLSDWRTFLTGLLNDAFPDHSDSDRHEVYRVLATNVAEKNKSLTIRELKLFVNQIGAIHRQWAGPDPPQDTFPLSLIAYYVLLRRDGADVATSLFDPDFPSLKYHELLGSDIREALAAIAFNVDVGAARQLLFSDKIKNALTLGDPEELKKVASLLSKGFWDVFEQIAKDWARSESSKVPDAALALEASGLAQSAYAPSLRFVMRAFCDSASSVLVWSPFNDSKARGLAVILKWKKNLHDGQDKYDGFAARLFNAIALGLKDQGSTDLDEGTFARQWLVRVNELMTELEQSTKQITLKSLVNTVSDQVKLPAEGYDFQWERYIAVMFELERDPEIGPTVSMRLKDLADNELLQKEFVAKENISASRIALLSYLLIRYSSAVKRIPTRNVLERENELQQLFSEPVAKSFLELVERYQQLPLLFEAVKASQDVKHLVVGALRLALGSRDAKDLFTGSDTVERLEFVFSELGASEEEKAVLAKLLSEVKNRLDITRELVTREFKPSCANLYLEVLQSGSIEKDFVTWCVDGLRSSAVSDALWADYIYYRRRLLALALHLQNTGIEMELGEQYLKALEQILARPAQGEWPVLPHSNENIVALVGPLGSEARNQIQEKLRQFLWTGALPAWFFQVFGAELELDLRHSEQAINSMQAILRQRKPALEWLKETLARIGSTLDRLYANPEWVIFKNSIRQTLMFGNVEGETFPAIQGIAEILHIEPVQNGGLTFTVFRESKIYLLEPRAQEPTLIFGDSSTEQTFAEPNWSPDGTKVAYTSIDIFKSDIFIFDTVSGSHTRVTNSSTSSSHPTWSPDGNKLAFVRENGSDTDIFTIDLHTQEERKVTQGGGRNEHPSWSPNGQTIVFHHLEKDVATIRGIHPNGSEERRLTDGPRDFEPSWFPGGREVIFARRGEKESGIVVTDVSTTRLIIPDTNPYVPAYSPDGKWIAFQSGLGHNAELYVMDVHSQSKNFVARGIDPTWRPLVDSSNHSDSGADFDKRALSPSQTTTTTAS